MKIDDYLLLSLQLSLLKSKNRAFIKPNELLISHDKLSDLALSVNQASKLLVGALVTGLPPI